MRDGKQYGIPKWRVYFRCNTHHKILHLNNISTYWLYSRMMLVALGGSNLLQKNVTVSLPGLSQVIQKYWGPQCYEIRIKVTFRKASQITQVYLGLSSGLIMELQRSSGGL